MDHEKDKAIMDKIDHVLAQQDEALADMQRQEQEFGDITSNEIDEKLRKLGGAICQTHAGRYKDTKPL